jgi:hypothetical protein
MRKILSAGRAPRMVTTLSDQGTMPKLNGLQPNRTRPKPVTPLRKTTFGKSYGRLRLPQNNFTSYGGFFTMPFLPKQIF